MPTPLERFRQLTVIRLVEERILELFAQGKLYGTTHTCIGQEANAVAVVGALRRDDIVFSNHRCHGHYIAKTGDVEGLLAELMGRETGVCGGISGSQHLCRDGFYSNGIQGGIVPNAVGMALAEKMQGSDRIAVVFLGDGTLGEGAVYESMNIASLWSVPILFVIEHNQYAQSTPSTLQIAGSVEERSRSFGIPTISIDSTDVEEIQPLAERLVEEVRQESAPRCLVIHTYRLAPHSKGDDYRDPEEIEERRLRDPLILAAGQFTAAVTDMIEEECQALVDEATRRAEMAPPARPGLHMELQR